MIPAQWIRIVAVLFMISSITLAKLNEVDSLSLLQYKFYTIERQRWGDLSAYAGYQLSDKLLSYKNVETPLGSMKLPVEDLRRKNELNPTDYNSILLGKKTRYDGEDDSALGLELIAEGEYQDAEAILKMALSNVEKDFGKDHVLYANANADLGALYIAQDQFDKAIPYYEIATEIDQKSTSEFGSKNYASSATMLAICAIRAGRENVHAISSMLEDVFQVMLQTDDDVITNERYKVLINLANIYQRALLPIRSIALLKTARALVKDNARQNSKSLLNDIYLFLGTSYVMAEEYSRAKTLLSVASEAYDESDDSYYNECEFQLATVSLKTGEYELAFKRLMKLQQKMNKNDEKMILVVCTMGQALLEMNEIEKAIMFLTTASSMSSALKTQKTDRPLLELRIASSLASAYEKSGEGVKERNTLKKAIEIGTTVLGDSHPLITQYEDRIKSAF